MKLSQKEVILKRCAQVGYIDNFWCIAHNILRLGARIHDLRDDGYRVVSRSGRHIGKSRRNWLNQYYYIFEDLAAAFKKYEELTK